MSLDGNLCLFFHPLLMPDILRNKRRGKARLWELAEERARGRWAWWPARLSPCPFALLDLRTESRF